MKNFIRLVKPFFYGEDKVYARLGALLLLVLSQITTSFSYFFIQWNYRFYTSLENRNLNEFLKESIVFIFLAASLVAISSYSKYFGQQYAIRWRIWMTNKTLDTWLYDSRRGELEGSDQRIQEDLMRFTTLFERFFIDCFNALILILILVPTMFIQTNSLILGNMAISWWLLIGVSSYTIIGMLISSYIARPLVQYEYDNQKLEAQLRYSLVHARDGNCEKPDFFSKVLNNISANYKTIYSRQKYFNIWQKLYDQCSFLIPFTILASNYFSGIISFGILMQVKSTFSRIRNSMAYILDHYTELTEMLAICKRLVEFYDFSNFEFYSYNAKNLKSQPDAT